MSNVSVVVATRNRVDALAQTLPRLIELPERPPVTVVDNGSADRTVALLRDRFPEVGLVALGRNGGAVARAYPHRRPAGAGAEKGAMRAGNAVLTAWMRRPLRVALGATARLLRGGWHDAAARRGFRRFAARLPSALAARRAPHPVVEAE